MPKRVLDFDAMWASDKLASCAAWAQAEYAWFYGLADASGSFEMTNLRVIWGRVAAIRTNLTIERLEQIFDEFSARGLLFTWEESGKRYGHWTGSDVPGRLPPPSWRARLEKLAPPVPKKLLSEYEAKFSRGMKPTAAAAATVGQALLPVPPRQVEAAAHATVATPNATVDRSSKPSSNQTQDLVGQALLPVQVSSAHGKAKDRQECLSYSQLKPSLEAAQGQGLDLDLEGNREGNAASGTRAMESATVAAAAEKNTQANCFYSAEKTAEKPAEQTASYPRSSDHPTPRPAYYPRDARALEVAKELYVGLGPVLGPHSSARVKPEALERARRTEEAACAARNARRACPG